MARTKTDQCIANCLQEKVGGCAFENQDKSHILVACMPKSGSTYLTAILTGLPGFRQAILVPDSGRREQELDRLELIRNDEYDYVAQHHVRFSTPTQTLLEDFNIKPIVTVRNIYDALFSIRDHFRNESTVKPMGYAFPYMKDWPDEQLEEFIADIFTPWYFNFFLSWQEYENKHMISYDELIDNPLEKISEICSHLSLSATRADIDAAIARASGMFTRRNIGISGCGGHLNDYCKARVEHMARYYCVQDFSAIGIFP